VVEAVGRAIARVSSGEGGRWPSWVPTAEELRQALMCHGGKRGQ
jgi:hypothetical protein